jgi:hypothetical protein
MAKKLAVLTTNAMYVNAHLSSHSSLTYMIQVLIMQQQCASDRIARALGAQAKYNGGVPLYHDLPLIAK